MSFNYNHIMLVGRLTRDAEVKEVAESARAVFSLAVNRPYRKDDGEYDTDFVPIVAWGRLAEIAAEYLKKGSPILVEGRLQVRRYEKNEETRYMSEVIADNFQMLGTAKKQSDAVEAPVSQEDKELSNV